MLPFWRVTAWHSRQMSPVSGRRPLDRFLSTISSRLDGKGRVSVPASFRAVLEADGHPGVFVHQALDAPALECGGHRLLHQIDTLIGRFSPYSDERDLIATALLGGSEIIKMDPEGRVMLPERFKTFAEISSEVVFVGLGDKFRIWAPARFAVHLEEANSRLRSLRARLSGGNGGQGPTTGTGET